MKYYLCKHKGGYAIRDDKPLSGEIIDEFNSPGDAFEKMQALIRLRLLFRVALNIAIVLGVVVVATGLFFYV